jgi:tetratricopeptide (TPR) repeat protein
VIWKGIAGTPLYMAPEQWDPRASLNSQADIYALGCVLYESVLNQLACAHWRLGETSKACQLFERLLAIARRNGDRKEEAEALTNLATVYLSLDSAKQAIRMYQEALAVAEKAGETFMAAAASYNLATALSDLKQSAEAQKYARQAADLFRQVGDVRNENNARQLIAEIQAQAKRK